MAKRARRRSISWGVRIELMAVCLHSFPRDLCPVQLSQLALDAWPKVVPAAEHGFFQRAPQTLRIFRIVQEANVWVDQFRKATEGRHDDGTIEAERRDRRA